MSWADCPHCGERNFTISAWTDLDRCASCGQTLATEAQLRLAAQVREALRRRRFRQRRAGQAAASGPTR